MIKLNIINLSEFLNAVGGCSGPIYWIRPDGRKQDIRTAKDVQQELRDQYRKNKNWLPMSVDIPAPKDYLRIVNYYIGDC